MAQGTACFAAVPLVFGAFGAVAVDFGDFGVVAVDEPVEQVEPVTAKLYVHTPKPFPVTERPAMVRFPELTQAGAL